MAGNRLIDQIFPASPGRAKGSSLLDDIYGEAPRDTLANRITGRPPALPEGEVDYGALLGLGPRFESVPDAHGVDTGQTQVAGRTAPLLSQDTQLSDLETAPAPPPAGASRMEKLQYRIDRQDWDRHQRTIVQRVEESRQRSEAAARDQERMASALLITPEQARTARAIAIARGAPDSLNPDFVKEVDAAWADYDKRRADDDPMPTVALKWLQNLPERAQRWVVGLNEAMVNMPRDPLTWAFDAAADKLSGGKTALIRNTIHGAIKANDAKAFREATDELQRNAPNVEQDSGAMFAYDTANAFVDMGTAVAASALTRNPEVGAAVMGAQVFGDKYGDSLQRGRTPAQAFIDASVYGTAEFLGEKIVLRSLMRPGGTFLGKTARTAALEAIQESVTQVLQDGYDAGVIGEDMTLGQAIKNMVRAGLIGGIVGGGIGAAHHAGSKLLGHRSPGEAPGEAAGAEGPLGTGAAEIASPAAPAGDLGASRGHGVSVELTPEDEASPLPSDLIARGKGVIEAAQARNEGLPSAGSRVVLEDGSGVTRLGQLEEIYQDKGVRKVRVRLDNGTVLDEASADLRDAGVNIRPVEEALSSEPFPDPADTRRVAHPVRPAPGGHRREQFVMGQHGGEPTNEELKPLFRSRESTTDDQATNPRSTASGRYQFTKGTWEGLGGDWSKRFDVAEQERLMDHLLDANRAALKRAGLSADAANMYAAHHFGAGSVIEMQRNPQGALDPRVVTANPQLRGMNNGQALAWARNYAAHGSSAAAAGGEALAESPAEPDTSQDILSEPLRAVEPAANPIPFDQPAERAPAQVAETPPAAEPFRLPGSVAEQAAPPITLSETKSGKGLAIAGATTEQIAAIKKALPDTAGSVRNAKGETVFSKKYERQIRDMLDPDGSLGIRAAMPERQRDMRSRPDLGPTFSDPQGDLAQAAVLRSAHEGRRNAVETLPGPSNWLMREGYATEAKRGRLELTEKGYARLAELTKDEGGGAAVEPSGSRAPSEPAASTVRTPLPDLDAAVARAPREPDVAITGTGREVPVRYAVVEASQLVTSNTGDGRVNPDFPAELQPRDRGRGASQVQVVNIASNLDPRLLGPSPKASDGAPIIDHSGVVLSGNGRSLALQRAYAAGGEQADGYRQYLTDQGFDTEGMKEPVLVRVASEGMTPVDRQAFTREANERDNLGFSASEQAQSDAKAMGDRLLELYRGGDIDQVGNRDFARTFIGSVVPANDQAHMVDAHGALSQQAVTRIRAALLAKAYENPHLLAQATESTDTNIKGIAGALTDVSAVWATMRAAAAAGRIDPKMDATHFLNDAVAVVDRARREGRAVSDYVNQRDIFSGVTMPAETEAFLRLMFVNANFTRATGRARLADALRFYVEQAMLTAPTGGLFQEEASRSTPLTIAALAKDRQDAGQDGKRATGQGDLLAAANAAERARASERPSGEERAGSGGEGLPAEVRTPTGEPAARSDARAERAFPTYRRDSLDDQDEARRIATELVKAGHTTSGLTEDYTFSFGDGVREPGKPPPKKGTINIELNTPRGARYFSFSERDIKQDAAASAEADARLEAIRSVEGPVGIGSPEVQAARKLFNEIPADPPLDDMARRLWMQAKEAMGLTAEEEAVVKRDARAVAALAGRPAVGRVHIAEALSYVREWRDRSEPARQRLEKQGARAPLDLDALKRDAQANQVSGRGKPATGEKTDMKGLMGRAAQAQAQLASFISLGLNRRAGVEVVNPGHKSAAGILEKVTREGYASAEELKDIARAAFVVDSPTAAESVVKTIKGAFKGAEDRGWRMLDSGYLDRKVIVQTRAGLKAELQVVPRPIWDARNSGGWKLYKKWRTTPAGPAANTLLEQMRATYSSALEGSDFASLSAASRSASGNSSAASSRESATPSLFDRPSAETQAPSRQTQAEPPSPRSATATSRPSISKNATDTGDTSTADIEAPARKGKVKESQIAAAGRSAWEDGDPREVPSYVDQSSPEGRAKAREFLAAYDEAEARYDRLQNPGRRPAPEVSPNKIFTEEAADRARELLRQKFTQINLGIDPELAQAGITLAGYHIEKGARTFAAYAKAMIADLGEAVRPYLRSWYESIRFHPGMESVAAQMSGPEEIGAALADLERSSSRGNAGTEEKPGGVQGTLFEGDVRAGTEDAGRAASERRADQPPAGEEQGSPRAVRPADGERAAAAERAGEGSPGEAAGREAGAGADARVPEREPVDGRGRRDGTAAPGGIVATENWHIEPGALAESRPAAQKARDNLRAIEIVKELDESGQPATAEQQAELARYVGWGGLKNAFNETVGTFPKGFEEIGPRLKELLGEEEYDTARRSIQYAHYTSEKVVRPMWDAAQRLGFTGGKVFEPGMGTGNFLGMMPVELAAKSEYAGLEFDRTTARIAQLLYPKAGIQHADYTTMPMPKNHFDLVIGNPPFAGTVIRSDPAYAKEGFVLHDFFFAKSLDAVRPGGLLIFVTSAGTMNKLGSDAREWLAERADLVGAVRLPGDAFLENAGTAVTADIVVLRKKNHAEAAAESPWAGDRSWIETVPRELPDREGGRTTVNVNRYFSDHPEMVLGEEGVFDKTIGGDGRYGVRAEKGADLSAALAAALDRLPADIMTLRDTKANPDGTEFGGRERKDGSYYLAPDGRLMQQRGYTGHPVETRGKGVAGGIPIKDQERIKALIPIRDALRDVYDADLVGNAAKGEVARKALNSAYDRFLQRHGPVNKAEISYRRPTVIQQEAARNVAREEVRLGGGFFLEGSFDPSQLIARKASTSEIAAARRAAREAAAATGREWDEGSFDPAEMPDQVIVKRPNIDPFMDDQEGYRLRAIEHYNDDTGEAKKGNVFFENVISKEVTPKINSAGDALLYTLNRLGRPDVDEIARLAKMSRSEVLEALADKIFPVPGQGQTYQTRELYLSGNVREKLEIARAAAERDGTYRRNVEALEAVQPTPLGPADITANLGMPWIPPETVEEFAASLGLAGVKVRYRKRLAQWSVEGNRQSAASTAEWGTSDRDAITLMQDALNRQDSKVYKKVRDSEGHVRDVLDETATQAAQDKARAIRDRFSAWVWEDTARSDKLAGIYNRDYNNLVAPVYDGSYLTTPGIASTWRWRPHQQRVIARIIQSGNTYMAHGVGAGKTSAAIGAGMEMRRLGLIRKPMYTVPNHMLGQFTKEFYEQYPTANVMVADERQFHTDRRKQFVANMAAQDIDAVIITHSAFGYIPISDQFMADLIRRQIDDYRAILDEVKAETKAGDGRGDRITQRRIEQQIEALQQKLAGRAGTRKDQVFNFEQTGIDFLFVDEAHMFRKLDFATRMGNVRGIDPQGSQASFDLYAKTRYLEQRSPGRSHVLMSGTAVTNTMAELYSLSKYLQPGALAERGLSEFDAWAGAFGETVTALEQDPAGGYKPQTRFARFVNVPELSAMVRQVMDVVTSKQLEDFVVRPKIKNGRREMVLAKPTPALEDYQRELQRRMKAIQRRSGPPQKGDDILLSVIGDGRKAAIDMRLIDPHLPRDEGSKLELMIGRVFKTWERTKSQPFHRAEGTGYAAAPYRRGPATQLVFSDLGINGEFPIHQYIRNELVRLGIPRGEIAIVSEAKSHIARQRLFNDVNEGKVRVMIGSVPKMGTGVNAQKQLYAIHNLDPQWYPANDEQRNGRGLRQGNENPEIEITDYSTKGTYDSTMWGLMETKARFIEGFFAGDPTMRTMDDLGEASQYEQAKAITTADPRILELTGYKQDLERALIRRAAFEREQYSLRERIADAGYRIDRAKKQIPHLEADIAQRVDISGDAFSGKVGDQSFTERKPFGEAVIARIKELAELGVKGRDKPVGELGGFKLTADVMKWEGWEANLYINLNGERQERISADNPMGLITSASAVLRGMEAELAKARDSIERNQAMIEDLTPQTGKEFQGQAEIDDLKTKVDAIEKVLTAEAAERASIDVPEGAPPAGQKTPAYDIDAVKKSLRDELEKVGLAGRVLLEAETMVFPNPNQAGSFRRGTGMVMPRIRVSLNAQDPRFTLDHEIIHALRSLGLLRTSEWSALAAHVRADRALMKSVGERYGELDQEGQLEEAVSDAYALWQEKKREARGFVRGAFDRITRFLTAVYRAVAGTPAHEQVFQDIASGEVAARENGLTSADTEVKYGLADWPAEKQAIVAEDTGEPDEPTISTIMAGTKKLTARLGETYDEWKMWLQDRMLPVLRTQQAAEQILGRELTEEENPYLAEELMSGKAGAQLEDLAENHVNPLFEAMKAEKVDVEELESYLYARHAPERNARIAEINPEFEDGKGSGMSDIEARAILARIDAAGRTESLKRVATYVDKILKLAMDVRVQSGLISEETAQEWRDLYKHYVPLRGFAEVEGAVEEAVRPHSGGTGITVRGQESKPAFGRRSMADDILAYSIMQAEEAIVRGRKNDVARAFYDLAKATPDDNFWKINKVTMKRRMNPLTGLVESYPVTALTAEDKDWTVSLKIAGKARRVTMNRRNPAARRLAKAMRRLDEQQVGKFVRFFGAITRFLSAANTGYNPEFVITNAFRDIQTAGVNMAGIDKKGLIGGTLRDYPKAMVGSMKGAFGKEEGDWGKWYREFLDSGGRVYFNKVQDLGTLQRDIEKRVKGMQIKKLSPGGTALRAKELLFSVGRFVGAVNNGVENAVRLSAFKNARELGMSPAAAASLAKNLTVNFNRRGTAGTGLNAAYMFFNASIQGTARMLVAMKSRRVQKVLLAGVALGAALDALNMMTSGRDDDDELFYDKISDFEKSRNLIIMIPGDPKGTYIKIPLPYGYNIFVSMGRSAMELMRGKQPMVVGGHLASTVADAFNPLGGTNSLLNFVAPTVLDPVVDLTTNRDFAGRPIMPDQNPFDPPIPDNQRYWGSVNPVWKTVASVLNTASGGDEVVPGAVDVSPETLEYLFGTVTGAAGAFYNNVLTMGEKGAAFVKGEDPELTRNDIPLVHKLVGQKPRWYDRAAFRTRVKHVEQVIEYAKAYAEKEGRPAFERYVAANIDVVSMEGSVKQAQKQMREIRKERGQLDILHDSGRMSQADYKAKNKVLDALEEKVMMDFNATYLQTVKRPKEPD